MENFNGLPIDNFQNESSFLQYGQIPPYTQHASLPSQTIQTGPSQTIQTGPYFNDAIETRNVRSSGVSAHSIELLETNDNGESRKSQAKLARANRIKERSNKKTNPTSSRSICCLASSGESSSKKTSSRSNISSDYAHRIFYTPDNVKLCMVLRKTLTSSDVGDQGRILLPKREAEKNLPCLASKAGVEILMREFYSNTVWLMKYRFWLNPKGHIYLFDQCGDFIKKNMLEAGDHLELYQDEQRNLYFTVQKNKKSEAQTSDMQRNIDNSYISMMSETTEEEDWTLRILMEELKHEEDNEANTLPTRSIQKW